MQRLPQHAWPIAQPAPPMQPVVTHMPPRQVSLAPHARPQAPQLALSVVSTRQTPEQLVVPAAQDTAHTPEEHT